MIDSAAVDAARHARARVLAERSNEQVIDVLAEAGTRWRSSASADRATHSPRLYEALPLSPDMIDHGLDLIFGALTKDALQELVFDQVESPSDLGRSRSNESGSLERFMGPELLYHSLAGNIPGLAIAPIVCGVLARSITMIRDSRRQPILTHAFLDTLSAIDPLLGSLIVPVDSNVTALDARRALTSEDAAVELHGSDEVVDQQAKAFSGIETVRHGSRTSAVIAGVGTDPGEWAHAIAHDVVMYEGLGCLTPHILIVEGGAASVAAWNEALGPAFDAFETRWPRFQQPLARETERRSFLERAEVSSLLGDGVQLARGHNDDWCILSGSRDRVGAGVGMRCFSIVATSDRNESISVLSDMTLPIAGIGLTLPTIALDGNPELDELRRRSGATLICSAGDMQAPPLGWEQDGKRRLGDHLDWRASPA